MKTRIWFCIFFFSFITSANSNQPAKIIRLYSNTSGGFAGLKDDGSVATWGNTKYGGDSSSVAHLFP